MIQQLALVAAAGIGSTFLPGLCNLSVIATAHRRGAARGTAFGAGVALGDATYAALAVLGLGAAATSDPDVAFALRAITVAAAVAVVIAVVRLRRRPPAAPHHEARGLARAVVTGYLLRLACPAGLLTWTALALALPEGSAAGTALHVACVGAGSFAGFAVVAHVWPHAVARVARRLQLRNRAVVATSPRNGCQRDPRTTPRWVFPHPIRSRNQAVTSSQAGLRVAMY